MTPTVEVLQRCQREVAPGTAGKSHNEAVCKRETKGNGEGTEARSDFAQAAGVGFP